MGGTKRVLAQPLLQESTLHSTNSSVKVFALILVLISPVLVMLSSWLPNSSNADTLLASQSPTVDMFNSLPSRVAASNRFLSPPLQVASRRSPSVPSQRASMWFPTPRVEAKAQLLEKSENSWQTRLDKALLNLDVEPRERLSLLQEAFSDPVLAEDLRSAAGIIQEKGFGEGHPEVIEKLWPKGTTARADLEGLAALRKQVPEVLQDVRSQVQQSPGSFFPQTRDAGASPPLPDIASVFGSLQTLVTDAEKQREIIEETKDLLRSTPRGLETPHYQVTRMIDGPLFLGVPEPIELRQYESFTVARTTTQGAGFTSSSGATGFNTLASYLFGKNQANEAMKMTMPVEMSLSSGEKEGTMAFVLPAKNTNEPPVPLATSNITIDKVPARLVAAKPFPGIVTDEEVQRQKVALLSAIRNEGSVMPVDEDQVIVLQYNSPLTVPWRRRNEVAVVVTEKPMKPLDATEAESETAAKAKAEGEATAARVKAYKAQQDSQ